MAEIELSARDQDRRAALASSTLWTLALCKLETVLIFVCELQLPPDDPGRSPQLGGRGSFESLQRASERRWRVELGAP
eukprot:COSAG04_NODE_154_length_22391_cov_6.579760_8_plen_78_part_00